MWGERKKERDLFMGLVKTGGGEAGKEYLKGLSDEDLSVLHDATHLQMAMIVAKKDRYTEPTEEELHRASDLVNIHAIVWKMELEREQGYPMTEEQHEEGKKQAGYFLAKMLHMPEDHVDVITREEAGDDAPRIRAFRPGDPEWEEADARRKAHAKKEQVTTPEEVQRVIEALLNDPSTHRRSLPPA